MALTDIGDLGGRSSASDYDSGYNPSSDYDRTPTPSYRDITIINETTCHIKMFRRNNDQNIFDHSEIPPGGSKYYSERVDHEVSQVCLEFFHNGKSIASQTVPHYIIQTRGDTVYKIKSIPRPMLTFRTVNHNTVTFDDTNNVARGASAVVYKGEIEIANKPKEEVAIKMFSLDSQKEIANFNAEVGVNMRCSHKNVVRYIDHFNSAGSFGIVMEYAPLGSLHTLNKSTTQLTPANQLDIAMDAAYGLNYLHSLNIVHRDIKSLNLLVIKQGSRFTAKWTDFGLAKLKQETTSLSTVTARPDQEPGHAQQPKVEAGGTVRWAPPEILKSSLGKPSFAADMWSLGMVLWEIYSRKIPFEHCADVFRIRADIIENGAENVFDGGEDEIPALSLIPSPTMARLIANCWSKDKRSRPSASAAVIDLERARSEMPAPARP